MSKVKNVTSEAGVLTALDEMSNLITEYQKENFKFLSGESVASVQSGQIKPDEQGRFIKSAINWFKDWLEKNKHSTEFENDQLGMVIIAPAGIKSAMSHKPRPIDVQALPVLPHVIKKARVISITKDDTGKPIENIILAAPIVVDGQRCHIVIRLRKYYEIKGEAPRYYTQAVAIETNTATSNQTEHLGDKSLTRFGESGGRDRLLNVLHDALNVNIEQKSKKIKVYGWKAIEMARNLTFEQLEILTLKTQKEHFIPKEQRTNIFLYDQKGRKKLDVLSWAVHHKLEEFKNNPNENDKPLDHEDLLRIRNEFQVDYEQGEFDSVDGFDSIDEDGQWVLDKIDSMVSVLAGQVINQWDSEQADKDFDEILKTNNNDYIKSAKSYFSEKLQSKQVKTAIGLVVVNSKSKGKMLHRLRPSSALVIPRIPEILMYGKIGEREELNKERSDDFVAFYTFEKVVQIEKLNIIARIKVGELSNGLLAYYLAAKKEVPDFDSSWVDDQTKTRGHKEGLENQLTDCLTCSKHHRLKAGFDSIESQEDYEINIDVQVLDKDGNVLSDEEEAYVFGEMSLPQSTFRNAGTGVNTRIVIIERHSNPEDAPSFPRNMNFSHAESPEQLFEMIRHAQVKPRKLRIDEQLDRYGLYMRTERSNYIFNGDGLNVDYIKKILTDYWFADVNEYGEVVMPYNKSVEIIKKIKEFESSQLAA